MYYFDYTGSIYQATGDKAAQFLHGQLTNDIKALKDGESSPNLMLTGKGRVVSDLLVWRRGDTFWFIVNPLFKDRVIARLSKIAPLSRVHIEKGKAAALDLSIKEKFILHPTAADEIARVEGGIPKVGQDVTEDHLPQEGRLDHCLNFDKGCYLGQETIARLHYRGHVNKLLVGLVCEGGKKPKIGDIILRESAGSIPSHRVTSSVFSARLKTLLCLGYVPYKNCNPGEKFVIGESRIPAAVISLPVSS